MPSYYEMVKENAGERAELTQRQDEDVILRNLVEKKMKGFDRKTEVEGIFNVTLNRPKTMAAFIISALGNTSEQILVETEDKNLDTDYIKDFRRLAFAAADARLSKIGRALNPYLDEQACIRGGTAVRCLFQMVDGALLPDLPLWDYRYVNFEMGDDLEWAAYGFGTRKKKAAIEGEKWWGKRLENAHVSGKEAEVVDVWTKDHNEIWLSGNKVFEQKHNFGYVPVVIQGVLLGSMLADTDDIKNQNESIFFLIREAVPELNRLVSIIQTLAFNALKPPEQFATKEGVKAAIPSYNEVVRAGSLTPVDIGGGVSPINIGDANRASQMAMERMDRNMNEGGFIPRQLDNPAPSGVALIIEKEGKDVIYLPRLQLKASVKQALGNMFSAQLVQMGGEIEIGTPGHKRTFRAEKLAGPYEVTHKFSVKSLATDAGRASLAAAYGNLLSDHDKRRLILQLEDPDGAERWLSYEEAERLSPILKLRRNAEDLIALGKGEEAKLITDEAGVALEQLLTGNVTRPKPATPKEASQVVSLFGGGTGRGGQPAAPLPPVGG
mgnify:CR=1 FL=1